MRRSTVVGRAAWLCEAESVGDGAELHGRPTIYAASGHLRVGGRFRLWSRPVASHLSIGDGAMLQIGDDVSIGHGAAISAHERVSIGHGTCIGPYVVIMDTNFHGGTGDQSVHHETRPVVIGDGCRIGTRVTITRGAAIGDGAIILAGSVVSSVVPAGVCAGGARARVLSTDTAVGSWADPAAMLPELLRDVMSLEQAPDLSTDLSTLPWTPEHEGRLVDAIHQTFGVRLGGDTLRRPRVLADAVAAIERTRTAPRDGGGCL